MVLNYPQTLKIPIWQIFMVRLGLRRGVWMSEKKEIECNGNEIFWEVLVVWHLDIYSGMKKSWNEKECKLIYQREWRVEREFYLLYLGNVIWVCYRVIWSEFWVWKFSSHNVMSRQGSSMKYGEWCSSKMKEFWL